MIKPYIRIMNFDYAFRSVSVLRGHNVYCGSFHGVILRAYKTVLECYAWLLPAVYRYR